MHESQHEHLVEYPCSVFCGSCNLNPYHGQVLLGPFLECLESRIIDFQLHILTIKIINSSASRELPSHYCNFSLTILPCKCYITSYSQKFDFQGSVTKTGIPKVSKCFSAFEYLQPHQSSLGLLRNIE